jgi:hypothetical protein
MTPDERAKSFPELDRSRGFAEKVLAQAYAEKMSAKELWLTLGIMRAIILKRFPEHAAHLKELDGILDASAIRHPGVVASRE